MSILSSTHAGKFVKPVLQDVVKNYNWKYKHLMTNGDGTQSLALSYDNEKSILWQSYKDKPCDYLFSGHVKVSDDHWKDTAYVIRKIKWEYELEILMKYFETDDPKLGEYIRDHFEEYSYEIKLGSIHV